MSIISTGLSGLVAAQRGLEATSNNVANAGTDGYVRRRIVQAEAITTGAGLTADLGSGVRVTGVERLYDAFLGESLRGISSMEGRAQIMSDLAARLDGLIGNPDLGLDRSIQAFFDQVELLGRDPTSAASRQALLAQGDSLSGRFQQLGTQLERFGDEVDRRLADVTGRINAIAKSLATINETLARGASGANDLLDQRDALLGELSRLIDANVLKQADGTTTVMIGNGQPLVLGINSAELTLAQDEFDPTRLQINIDFGAESRPISRVVSGGELGGLLAFRSEALDPARRELGLLAATITNAFNEQHALGVDARGNLGGTFFSTLQPLVAGSARNAGAATLTATVADATALQARDYELRFDGTAWSLADAGTGQPLTMTGTGSVADPFLFDGLALSVSAGAATNDRFLVRPVTDAASRVALSIADAGSIAAAAPVRTSRLLGNASDATIALGGISDVTNPALQQPVQLRFESAGTFRVYDGANNDLSGPLAYTSGADINFNGWTVRVSGSPATGDRFDVLPTPPGSADNGNALELARVARRGYLAGGQVSADDLSTRLVATVGTAAQRHSQDLQVQGALREQAQLDFDAVGGVNLDEEAANLLRYQQAYQAASKIIAVADELFQTLIGIIR
ncbi:MAG: flagellar hook-associated protein FlgK [Gammaproteobacteria bacterium]|nr:MAG: flagellar hook-associated protein FlgK [Gammaproteobacteria bacterium]